MLSQKPANLVSPLKNDEVKREHDTANKEGSAQLYFGNGNERISLAFICLPDTIDRVQRRNSERQWAKQH